MADIIKEAFNIEVNHMVQMLYLYQPHALRNSSLNGTVRAEPVGVLTEFCFTYRLHDLQNTLLYDPIYDSWNSQRSGLSIGLWYLHSPYGSWMIITELFLILSISFHVIAGKHRYGNYICIPNHDVGSELSEFRDLFWNTERLSGLIKKVDAVTVAHGLCHLEDLVHSQKSANN